MQIFPILVIAIVLAADSGMRLGPPTGEPVFAAAMAWGPVASVLLGAWLAVRWCRTAIDRGHVRSIMLAERITNWSRWIILLIHAAAVLAFGWLDAVRAVIGNLVLIDELIVILPPVLGVLGTWFIQYPIERRLREALLVRRLDMGKSIHPMPSRGQFIAAQARVNLLMLLVPLLMIVTLAEAIRMIAARFDDAPWWLTDGATGFAAIAVFITAPLMARHLLSLQPMPAGPLREELLNICRHHRVRVRDLLLWKTGGSMINAAVMGLFGRVRYVMITDGLLESMTLEQVKAVMAHEVGHVRRRHIPWMVATLIALIILATWLPEIPLMAVRAMGVTVNAAAVDGINIGIAALQILIALVAFGWVSRRFERQADTFAVQHLSSAVSDSSHSELGTLSAELIHPAAVIAMQGALQTIADLNAIDPHRHSWRHGSIAWRTAYLDSIIGRPIADLAIDRMIRWIKRFAAIVLVIAFTGAAWSAWNEAYTTTETRRHGVMNKEILQSNLRASAPPWFSKSEDSR